MARVLHWWWGDKDCHTQPGEMDHRVNQPANRDQIVAIMRKRAERANRDPPGRDRECEMART